MILKNYFFNTDFFGLSQVFGRGRPDDSIYNSCPEIRKKVVTS